MATRNGLFVEYCAKDFLDGTQTLGPWEELAYRRICDLIYATGDRLADDDDKLKWQTKAMGRWPRIKAALLAAGKLLVVEGRITNRRCQKMLEKSQRNIDQKALAGSASARVRKGLKERDKRPTAVATVPPATQEPLAESADAASATTTSGARLLAAFDRCLVETWGAAARRSGARPKDPAMAQRWADIGLDEAILVPWLKVKMANAKKRGREPPLGLALYDPDVDGILRERPKVGPSAPERPGAGEIYGAPADREADRQRAWMGLWRDSGFSDWPELRGPVPGQPGCRVRPEILDEFGFAPTPSEGMAE